MYYELVEACLNAFESFIKKCPKEISSYLKEVLATATDLMAYDPNYTYDVEGMKVEEEEEGWGSDWEEDMNLQEDDDDTSWKVRRASVRVIDSIIKTRPEMLREIYKDLSLNIMGRFKERDENVKCDILRTFCSMLKTTGITENMQPLQQDLELERAPSLVRQRSSAEALYEHIPLTLSELLKQLENKSANVRAVVLQVSLSVLTVADCE